MFTLHVMKNSKIYAMLCHKPASAPTYRTMCIKFPVMYPKELLGIFVQVVSTILN